MDETNPSGLFLVTSGSKGDRLLFRYPFDIEGSKETCEKKNKVSPYALPSDHKDELGILQEDSYESTDNLLRFDDKVLSNLFAVKPELCGQKFELKIENVRFIGHPTFLPNREQSTITTFNVVFALRADASYSVVDCYHDLCHKLSIAIRNEECRCNYLTTQAKIMQSAHDEVASMPEEPKSNRNLLSHKGSASFRILNYKVKSMRVINSENILLALLRKLNILNLKMLNRYQIYNQESPFSLILSKSELAVHLKVVFEDLKASGVVYTKINDWIELSFCLPNKVHRLQDERLLVEPENIQECMKYLRPYHGLLLLMEPAELLSALPLDSSPALIRLINVSSPLKNFQQLAADADIMLSHVFQLVGHLLYWGKATIIYPICESNVYMISPYAPTYINSAVAAKFCERFQNMSLLGMLSQFSLPISLSVLDSPMKTSYQQARQVQMVIWMLQHRLLTQLHTYVYLIPSDRTSVQHTEYSGGQKLRTEKSEQSVEFGSSYQSEESLLSPSHSKASSASDEEDLSLREQDCMRLENLTPSERQSILRDAVNNKDDQKTFIRLSPYFRGRHHLEEIMYCENIWRSCLLSLLDKFRNILITCQFEDAAVAALNKRL